MVCIHLVLKIILHKGVHNITDLSAYRHKKSSCINTPRRTVGNLFDHEVLTSYDGSTESARECESFKTLVHTPNIAYGYQGDK